MKKIVFVFLFVLLGIAGFSQTVLMHQDAKDTVLGKHGPNLKNFSHFYVGIGFIAGKPDSAGSDIKAGKSVNVVLGYRYKLKISNFYAIGYDIAYNSYSFSLEQDSKKITPDTVLHKKEKLNFGNLGLSPYMRFNYGRRGNHIGKFIDLGAYGDWTFIASDISKDKKSNGNLVKTKISHLNYYNATNYGVLVRIGFNRYVFYGNYRLSNIFKSSYNYPELPRIIIGLQIGFHK
jgi:hypothetical protein